MSWEPPDWLDAEGAGDGALPAWIALAFPGGRFEAWIDPDDVEATCHHEHRTLAEAFRCARELGDPAPGIVWISDGELTYVGGEPEGMVCTWWGCWRGGRSSA